MRQCGQYEDEHLDWETYFRENWRDDNKTPTPYDADLELHKMYLLAIIADRLAEISKELNRM